MRVKEKISFFVTLILFVLILILCNYIETTDIKKATVTKVENEIVTLVDEDGEEWQVAFDNFSVDRFNRQAASDGSVKCFFADFPILSFER